MGYATTTIYDNAGRATKSINPLGNVWTTVYDDVGQATESINPLGFVGTTNPEHLKSNIRLFDEQIPISETAVAELYRRFDQLADDWEGLI